MQLSVLNDLPKVITFDSTSYSFVIYVTAWNKFCMAYASQTNPHKDRIFSTVIDPEANDEYINYEPLEISTVKTVDDAVRHILSCLELMEEENEDYKLISGFEELDLDLDEEENHEVYCEAPEGMIPIVR